MRIETREDGMSGEKLDVWFEDQLVGHIERRSNSVLDLGFRYDQSWIDSRSSFPISTTMPLSLKDHEPSVVYPWFLNLLPEGRALATVGSILKVHELDVFAILGEMGRDLPGALDIRKSGIDVAELKPRYRRLSEKELAEVIQRLPERPMLVGEDGVHMSAAGAQDKLPVVKYNDGSIGLALDGAASTHILKPRNTKFRASVENEAFCLRLAAALGLPAAKASTGRVEDIAYLLVERYDRVTERRRVRRIHQEDLCQATGFPPYLKYEWNKDVAQPGPGLKHCMDALTQTSAAVLSKLRFLDMMLFNVLCGNVDAHAKNYSILIRPGEVSMAPIYDVVNGDIYPGVTRNLAMKIAEKQRGAHIHGRHWDKFSEENGLSATAVRRRVAELSAATLKALPGVVKEMEASDLKSGVYTEIAEYVTYYCRQMISNLKTDPSPDDDETEDPPRTPDEPSEEILISP
ncbi:HipA domain-containing protein [Phyllobacterium sp. LjRoot231]|uniref:HipA domain-containing protein n=1 Tax=Phyllobacterium sp. LjRoot231 TaxID=3342289 RepID=UPI003ED09B06